MYCPLCGQQQVSEITRFCSRCGFLLTGVAQVIANNGNVPLVQPASSVKLISPRRRGTLQGLFIFLIGSFLLVPLIAVLSATFHLNPSLVAVIAILSFCGGILRMLYALFFEESGQATVPNHFLPDGAQNFLSSFGRSTEQKSLPPQSANFAPVNSEYKSPVSQPSPIRENWRASNTNELAMPPSVTEDTTKLLDQQEPK